MKNSFESDVYSYSFLDCNFVDVDVPNQYYKIAVMRDYSRCWPKRISRLLELRLSLALDGADTNLRFLANDIDGAQLNFSKAVSGRRSATQSLVAWLASYNVSWLK